jgi:hypothetical protein
MINDGKNENGVKIRFDGKGTEFGETHRLLPQSCCMFDIDKMIGSAFIELEITRQNIAYIEYKTNFYSENNKIEFKALFELKFKQSYSTNEAMKVKIGTATFAQIEMAKMLNCRYFFIIATEGKSPFTFYEWIDNEFINVGILSYQDNNKKEMINNFWKQIKLL